LIAFIFAFCWDAYRKKHEIAKIGDAFKLKKYKVYMIRHLLILELTESFSSENLLLL